jgi:uncharacterized protein
MLGRVITPDDILRSGSKVTAKVGPGLSTGLGEKDYDLIIAADEPRIENGGGQAPREWRRSDSRAGGPGDARRRGQALPGHSRLRAPGRRAARQCGTGLGDGFLDQAPDAWRSVIETDITGTLI